MRNTTLRVWIGCLSCYNDGELVGKWYDAELEAADVTIERLHVDAGVLLPGLDTPDAARWTPPGEERIPLLTGCEEMWVFDHEGFGRLITGECSPATAAEIAELVKDLDDNDLDAFGVFYDNDRTPALDWRLLEQFRESYRGCHERERDWAQEDAEELHGEALKALPDDIRYAIDWEVVWQNMPDAWSERARGGGVHIFESI